MLSNWKIVTVAVLLPPMMFTRNQGLSIPLKTKNYSFRGICPYTLRKNSRTRRCDGVGQSECIVEEHDAHSSLQHDGKSPSLYIPQCRGEYKTGKHNILDYLVVVLACFTFHIPFSFGSVLTISLNALNGLNRMRLLEGIVIASPVNGLRPNLGSDWVEVKLPKSDIRTLFFSATVLLGTCWDTHSGGGENDL